MSLPSIYYSINLLVELLMLTTPFLLSDNTSVDFGLIILLILKGVFSESELWNPDLNKSFNMAISPLLLYFASIIVFKIVAIV